jgi:hypothetical protein
MSNNPTIQIAEHLLKQVENESPESLMWIISSINRMVLVDESMSLLEFKKFIGKSCPDTYNTFKSVMALKDLKTLPSKTNFEA